MAISLRPVARTVVVRVTGVAQSPEAYTTLADVPGTYVLEK